MVAMPPSGTGGSRYGKGASIVSHYDHVIKLRVGILVPSDQFITNRGIIPLNIGIRKKIENPTLLTFPFEPGLH